MIKNEDLEIYFYVQDSGIHGKGLFAKDDIEEGEYLGTYDGPEVDEDDSHVLWVEEEDGRWASRDGKNMLRYLNHSKLPHAEFDGFDLFALKNIRVGEEITIDYGEEP